MSSALSVCIHASETCNAEGVPIAPSRGRSIEVPFGREIDSGLNISKGQGRLMDVQRWEMLTSNGRFLLLHEREEGQVLFLEYWEVITRGK